MSLRAAVSKPSSLTIVLNCATIISPFAARGERQSAPAGTTARIFPAQQLAQIEDNFLSAIQSF
jgi:hypothetical protein